MRFAGQATPARVKAEFINRTTPSLSFGTKRTRPIPRPKPAKDATRPEAELRAEPMPTSELEKYRAIITQKTKPSTDVQTVLSIR